MLSIKGREPFIRMQIWLNDPLNVEKLHQIKEERDQMKRKRHSSSSNPGSPITATSAAASTDGYESYSSPSSAKKQRVSFSQNQKEALKIAFSLEPYPNPMVIDYLSHELKMEGRSITNWFHNHRMRLKQVPIMGQEASEAADLMATSISAVAESDQGSGGQQKSFDPIQFRMLLNQIKTMDDDQPESPLSKPEDLSGSGGCPGGNASDEDSRQSSGRHSLTKEDDDYMSRGSGGVGGGRSRRKPIAPQWVNPSEAVNWEDHPHVNNDNDTSAGNRHDEHDEEVDLKNGGGSDD